MSRSTPKSLRELRERSRLPVEEISRRAGVSIADYRRWEAGTHEIDLGRLRPLADAFGVWLDEIQLEPHRRHHNNHGYRFVLCARRQDGSEYRAQICLYDFQDAQTWAQRPIDPSDPDGYSPTVLQKRLEGDGLTRDEALNDLADRLDPVLDRAFFPDRLADDPEDWQPRPQPYGFGR